MYKYKIILYWSEPDNCYIAEVPELAGCMSDGKTPEETLKNVNVVIAEWLETAEELGRNIEKKIITDENCRKLAFALA